MPSACAETTYKLTGATLLLVKLQRWCSIQIIKRKESRHKTKYSVFTLEKTVIHFSLAEVYGKIKTYIWVTCDKVEGKGEVKLKGKLSLRWEKALNTIKQGYKTRNSSNNSWKGTQNYKTWESIPGYKSSNRRGLRANKGFARDSSQENKHSERLKGS